jgi:hypothetical protein
MRADREIAMILVQSLSCDRRGGKMGDRSVTMMPGPNSRLFPGSAK